MFRSLDFCQKNRYLCYVYSFPMVFTEWFPNITCHFEPSHFASWKILLNCSCNIIHKYSLCKRIWNKIIVKSVKMRTGSKTNLFQLSLSYEWVIVLPITAFHSVRLLNFLTNLYGLSTYIINVFSQLCELVSMSLKDIILISHEHIFINSTH